MKKIISLALALALLVGLAAVVPVAAVAEGDVPTVRIFMSDPERTDSQMVSDAVSDYVFERLGFKVQLVRTDDYRNKLPLLIASEEQMDAGFDAGWMDYIGRTRAGAYMELTDLLELVPDLKATIPQLLWDGVKIDGGIYAIPTYKELATQWGVLVEKEFIEASGTDPRGPQADARPRGLHDRQLCLALTASEAGDVP